MWENKNWKRQIKEIEEEEKEGLTDFKGTSTRLGSFHVER